MSPRQGPTRPSPQQPFVVPPDDDTGAFVVPDDTPTPRYVPLADTTKTRLGAEQREMDSPPGGPPPRARRRIPGISSALDWLARATSVTPPSATTMNPLAVPRPRATPMMLPPDPRTAEKKAIDQAADDATQHRQDATALLKQAGASDATSTAGTQLLPTGETLAQYETTKARSEATTKAAQLARSTPAHWAETARAMHELAARLRGEGRIDEASEAERKAGNAEQLSKAKAGVETKMGALRSGLATSVFLPDPYAQERENIRTAEQPGVVPSLEEQAALLRSGDLTTPAATPGQRPDLTRDLVIPLASQLPAFMAATGVGRLAFGAAGAAMAGRAPRIGAALSKLAGPAEDAVQGATIPTVGRSVGGALSAPITGRLALARLSEEGAALARSLQTTLPHAMTEGQVYMGVLTYHAAREAGASPEQALQAVAEGFAANAAVGAGLTTAGSIAGRIAGLTYDPIGRVFVEPAKRAVTEAVQGFTDRRQGVELPLPKNRLDAARARRTAIAGTEEVAQALPDPTARRNELADLLEQQLHERVLEPPKPGEPVMPPSESPIIRPGEPLGGFPEPDTPIRSMLDQYNAVKVLQERGRQVESAAAEHQAMVDELENDPNLRLERAAQAAPGQKQGPLTLAQTLARAGRDAEAGEPLAADYTEAINRYIDAAAAVKDAGEKGANTKQQVALARAKAALNAARTRYGKQLGASAVLALAANDDDLTDDEKKLVGLGALALSMSVVPEGGAGEPPTKPAGYYSRLRRAIEDRSQKSAFAGKRWDEPRPVGEWLNKLKGSNAFSKDELAFILPALEEVQAGGHKLARADVLQIADEKLPRIESVTLAETPAPPPKPGITAARVAGVVGAGADPHEIVDLDVITEGLDAGHPDVTDPGYLQWQIEARTDRVAELQAKIDEDIADYQSRMEDAESTQNTRYGEIKDTLRNAGVDTSAMDDAIDYINENTESGSWADIDKAFYKIWDDVREQFESNQDPHDILSEAGYTVKHEPGGEAYEASWGDTENEKMVLLTEPGDDQWGPILQSRLRARVLEQLGAQEGELFASTIHEDRITLERVPDLDEEAAYVVYDYNNNERGRGEDENNVIQEVISDDELSNDKLDDLAGELKNDLQRYTEALGEYQEAESEHYIRSEDTGSYYEEETTEIEQHNEEIGVLQDHRDRLITEREAAAPALAAGEPVAEPTAEATPEPPAEPGTAVALVRPEVTFKPSPLKGPKYQGTQMIVSASSVPYREMIQRWENYPGGRIPPEAYGGTSSDPGHDYWSNWGIENATGHMRVLVLPLHSAPGIDGPVVEFPAGEASHLIDIRRNIKLQRMRRQEANDRMAAASQEFMALPDAERDRTNGRYGMSQRAQDIFRQFETALGDVNDRASAEASLVDDLRRELGITDEDSPKVLVVGESQTSLSQHQVAVAQQAREVETYRAREAELKAQLDAAQDEWDRMVPAYEAAVTAFNQVVGNPNEWYRDPNPIVEAFHDRTSGYRPYVEDLPPDRLDILVSIAPEHETVFRDAAELARLKNDIETRRSEASLDWHKVRDKIAAYERSAGSDLKLGPFGEIAPAQRLNAATAIAAAANEGFDVLAWSTSGNRVANADLQLEPAIQWYDEMFPGAIRWVLDIVGIDPKAAGFVETVVKTQHGEKKKLMPQKVFIRGNEHWHIRLTREMREKIKQYGVPMMGVAAIASLPQDADAQQADSSGVGSGTGSLYATAIGGVVAGAALMALATSRKLRRLVRENRALSRELMIDDLSGLSNKRAFLRARPVVDADDSHAWVVFDGNRFKKLNDVHGHPAGDKAIQHFGHETLRVANDLDVPARAFRFGGDEIAVAVPKEHAAEFRQRLEEASSYAVGSGDERVVTSLTGAVGDTFEEADAMLAAYKQAARAADPSLHREAHITPVRKAIEQTEGGATFYANPIPQALRELARYPSSAAMGAVGAALVSSDDPDLEATGKGVLALAALHAVGSRRLSKGKDLLASALVKKLAQSEGGLRTVRFLNPETLLTPEVRDVIQQYERERARARSKAAVIAKRAKASGPTADRILSDLIENEGWEDTSNIPAPELNAIMTLAAEIDAEYQRAATEMVQTGARTPDELLPTYAGPRRYAYFEAQAAQAEKGRAGARASASTARISAIKHRTLDEPIRLAEQALDDARASNDPAAITDAEAALDEAKVVQMSRRVELGEIREQSYRAAQGIERSYSDAAAARLFANLRDLPGVVHPEWEIAITDLDAAKALSRSAKTPADRDAAKVLVGEAESRLSVLTRQFQRKDQPYVALPDVRALGKLRGAIVNRDVANSLVGFTDRTNAYSRLLRAWKEIKTVFNPGTHQGNIFSNIAFAHMEGLPLWEQPAYLKRAHADMKAYGPATKALSEAGILDVNAVTADEQGLAARGFSRLEGLESLSETTRPETADVLQREGISPQTAALRRRRSAIKGALAGGALGAAKLASDEEPEDALGGAVVGAAIGAIAGRFAGRSRTLYNNEDNIFRAAIWLRKVKDGMTPDEATAYTRNALGNFRSRSPALQVLRSTVAPFILYPAKALPRLGTQIVDHPWRYLTLIALWGGLNEYSQSQVGEVEDGDLPPGQRRRLGYFFPGFTQLPFTNAKGEKAGVDIARWTPMSAITSGAPPGSVPAAFNERSPDILRAGGPVVDLAARFGANVDPYSQKPAYGRDYPPKQNISSLLQDVSGTMLPSALDFHAERLREDVANRDWDKFKNDALGPTGLRPRFVRPGANQTNAAYTLENSLREMKQAFKRDLRYNKNPERVVTLRQRYLDRVHQAVENYKERVGAPPPRKLLEPANPDTP